jgi:hypothetical protein
MDSGRKGQLRQQYTRFFKACRNPLGKKKTRLEFLFDLTKAYDAINHDILVSKLNSYEVRGVANFRKNLITAITSLCVPYYAWSAH